MRYNIRVEDSLLYIDPPVTSPSLKGTIWETTDSFVLSDGGEVKSLDTEDAIVECLYDAYQTHDGLKEGDVFVLEGREIAECRGVHVVKI